MNCLRDAYDALEAPIRDLKVQPSLWEQGLLLRGILSGPKGGLIALAASFLSSVSLIIKGLFVHWCGALEHIGDVDDGALMLPSMWSIGSSTIPQTSAEEALCWVERKDAG
jgi:hypothetical protein